MTPGEWDVKPLVDLVEDTIGGLWGSAPDTNNPDEEDVLVVRGADFSNWSTRRAAEAAHRRVPARALPRRLLAPGDLVLEVSGGGPDQPVGRVIAIDEAAMTQANKPLITSNFCRKLRLKPGVNAFFVKRQLDWLYRTGHTDRFQTSTTNIRNLQVGDFLSGTEIVLPTAEEQALLTDILDQAEDKFTSSSAHLLGTLRGVGRLRQAVLAAACSGRLTDDWREANRETPDIKALLHDIDSLRKGRRRASAPEWEAEIPDSWTSLSLDSLTTLITSGSRGWAKHYTTDGPLFIRAQNIKSDRLDLHDMAHVRPPKGSEGVRTEVQKGDLLITITGANVTKSAFVGQDIGEAYVNQHVALARPVLPELTEYMHLWVVSPEHGRKKLSSDAYGAGRPGLNLDNLRTMPVGLPPLEEQAEIVARAKALLALADRIHERVVAAAHRIERSNQAVMAKAFRGELALTAGGAPS